MPATPVVGAPLWPVALQRASPCWRRPSGLVKLAMATRPSDCSEPSAKVAEIRVGDPREGDTTYGPLIHPVALERVTGHVARAREAGARLAFGGGSLGGLYFAPTLFADVAPDADILRHEVFGPVLTLQGFADEADAIRLANETEYGLAATIYTGSEERADRVSGAVVAGTVWVNCFYVRDLETPFGASGQSGIGREGGRHSFDFYCDVKTVCERTSLFA